MKHLLLFLVLLLISIPGLQGLRATQEVAYQGKPVPITLLGPKLWEQRTPFAPNSAVEDKFRLAVRDRAAWLDVWKRLYQHIPSNGPYPELPEVDFSREMLVVAAMGQQPTSGYSIIIDSAYERDDRLEVVVKSVITVKCGGVYMMVTAPLDIVRLPKMERAVVFREIEVVPECKFQ
jgi:hypothetical protein